MEKFLLIIMYRILHLTIIPFFLFLLVYSCANENSNDKIQYWNVFYLVLSIVSLVVLFKCKQIVFKMLCECLLNEFDNTDLTITKSIIYEKGFYYLFKMPENPDKANFEISCDYEQMKMTFKFRTYYTSWTSKKKFWIKSPRDLNNPIKISIFLYSSAKSIIKYVVKKEKRISSNFI